MKFPNGTSTRKRRYAICMCHCGNKIEIRKDQISYTKSCGCAKNQIRNEISIGQKINRWTILEDLGIKNNGAYRCRFVKVVCECNDTIYEKPFNSIVNNLSQSCGCLHKERASENCREIGKSNLKHGMDGTKIYKIWSGMKGRCQTETITAYERYGGRGIKVCEDWQSFEYFYEWAIISGYQEGLSIDRIDNDGNYEPNNCQWLTLSDNTKKMHEDKKKRADV